MLGSRCRRVFLFRSRHLSFSAPTVAAYCPPPGVTAYRSHFGDMDEIEAADSPRDYARMVVLAQLRGPSKGRATATGDQLALFS